MAKENKTVQKLPGDSSKIFCQEDYAQDLYDKYYSKVLAVSKDVKEGQILRVISFKPASLDTVEAICENFISFFVNVKKEKKYLEMLSMTEESFLAWVAEGETEDFLKSKKIHLSVENYDAAKGSLHAAHLRTVVTDFIEQIKNPTSAYTAKIISKNQGGFIVEVHGVKAFMPGSLAAANKIVNFEEYIGKEVMVMIEDYLKPSGVFVVSYKKYLDYILPTKLAGLERSKKLVGVVTGSSKYGIFAEFQDIFTGLLHTSEMSEDTLETFKNRGYKPGSEISVWLKEIRDNKLILTENDPSVREGELEAFREKSEGLVKSLKIASIKAFGAFLEVDNGVLGLLPIKELRKSRKKLVVGDSVNVCIKKVDTSSGKIYLTMIDERVGAEI